MITKIGRLEKLTVLQISLIIQRASKVNSCYNNVEYSTSKIVHITSSTMTLARIKSMVRTVDFWFC